MKDFFDAAWIWHDRSSNPDEYGEFLVPFDFFGSDCSLSISADSNYAVYLNGRLCAFGQYADYPHFKIYDKRDLTKCVRQGKNVLAIRVWYYGITDSSTYYPGQAGVLFALSGDGVPLAVSSEQTLSRLSPAYKNHLQKRITGQLGLSFEYFAELADGWMYADEECLPTFSPSVLTGFEPSVLKERTCLPTELGRTFKGRILSKGVCPASKKGVIFDLGSEEVGFIALSFSAPAKGRLTVAFGEHIVDGRVRQFIGGRDFSFVYNYTEGMNYYMNPFRRFGCRYVELITDDELASPSVSLVSVDYPLNELPAPEGLDPLQSRIYDACVHTLKNCMHEHYEDCPWREQALYAMDSRNQMLCGYYAFGEYLFPKSSLELIAQSGREDGLLPICYPCGSPLAIPSFSLHYVIECEEYLRYSGDLEFIRSIYPKLKSIVDVFTSRIGSIGLVYPHHGRDIWNFYEWEDDLSGSLGNSEGESPLPDVIINCLTIIAIRRLAAIEKALSLKSDLEELAKSLEEAVRAAFYDKERGLFFNRTGHHKFSRLGNSLAILAGVAHSPIKIAEEIVCSEDLTDVSLSMRCFFYDALLAADRQRFSSFILSDINRNYAPMLELGNNTVWETVKGESDFGNAGSLCHGWSAIPIYYYHLLLSND